MTAEVAVLSRVGVALAADSAVTVDSEAGKVYTSADKLFQLSATAPVGVMIYGNASFMDVPWETVIKTFRRRMGTRALDTLQEYAAALLDYLKAERALASEPAQKRFVRNCVVEMLGGLRQTLEERLDDELRKRGEGLLEDEIRALVDDLVATFVSGVEKLPRLDDLPANCELLFEQHHGVLVDEVLADQFQTFPISVQARAGLNRIALGALTRQQPLAADSGVVIAGFGDKELFPGIIELNVRGAAANTLLFQRRSSASIGDATGESSALIVPFAQTDMVHAFMEGIDPNLRMAMDHDTADLFRRFAKALLERVREHDRELGDKLDVELTPAISKLLDDIVGEWSARRRRDYVSPVMDMVRALPKDELALMAESLVNLDKFKRRVSRRQETVGGPIDVAVITKGDGFVWVRRKHYFRPELNLRLLAGYLMTKRGDEDA
jgi:hypothetical protein